MTNEIAEKWGFGMAPPKPATQRERSVACSSILNLLNRSEQPNASQEVLAHLSIAKGLFNRIVREDQWDWFTVSAQLGYPSRGLAHSIAFELSNLRSAIRYADATCFAYAHANLLRLPTRRCLAVFLGLARIIDEVDAGWIYILSTRELKDLLKIGMTMRTVEARAQEINSATGVAVPFGVRRCWRVSDPHRAEKIVHTALAAYRIRTDREFFRTDFKIAAQIAQETIAGATLEIRTLNAPAGLDTSNKSSTT
ncbi:MAG: GIY-YIG nuclease family protein [Terriglobales bacterium]